MNLVMLYLICTAIAVVIAVIIAIVYSKRTNNKHENSIVLGPVNNKNEDDIEQAVKFLKIVNED